MKLAGSYQANLSMLNFDDITKHSVTRIILFFSQQAQTVILCIHIATFFIGQRR